MRRIVSRSIVAAILNAVVAAGVVAFGIKWGTFAASDTDPYGYVSQADLIAHGSLRLEQPFVRGVSWPDAEGAFVPPGYALSADRAAAVPIYSTGLPLVMAVLQRATGRRTAVFYAVPVLGAIAVWLTGWLGARLHGPPAGFMAAVLLGTSPTFLYQVAQPVSDVPAAAWWTISLTLTVCSGVPAAFGAGAAAGMAALTRPNLAPLAVVLGAFMAWRAFRSSSRHRRAALARAGLFVVGVVPGFLAIAAINQYLHGSALRSGYGTLSELYSWTSILPNLVRYPRSMVEAETPLICLALAAPWVSRRQAEPASERDLRGDLWLLLTFAAVAVGLYLPWATLDLRYILPAYPPLIVLSAIVLLEVLRRIAPRRGSFLALALALTVAWAGWHWHRADQQGVFGLQGSERRYLDVSRYLAAAMPRETAFIAGLHSGSIRYHADRVTINFDKLDPRALDAAIAGLTANGFRPYIALERDEEPAFRRKFRAHSPLGALDWPPALHTSAGVSVRIYDPADRAHFMAGEAVGTADMLFRAPPLLTTGGQ
jgi:hypothetical protein